MNRIKPDSTTAPSLSWHAPVTGFLPRTNLSISWIASGLLAAGLIITLLSSLYVKAEVEAAAQREFDFICNEIQINIASRLSENAHVLYSGAALFDASEFVSRAEWQTFTTQLRVEQHLPGTQGIGFTLLIPPEQLDRHIESIREEGFPDYTILPAGEREIYTSIIYLEPFSGRNLRAFGYDMFSEPIRRAAMEQARDENIAVLSGKVILVQETDQDVQAGALMYVPVYRHGMPIETVEQRRRAIIGWVFSPYRMADLMSGTLRDWDVKQKDAHIYLQVYDGDVISPDTLLYDSQSADDKTPASAALVSKITRVDFQGRRWTLLFTQMGGLASSADYDSVWLVFFGGMIISLLLFRLTISLLSTRVNAQRIADQLTSELRESESRYRRVVENINDALMIEDINGSITYANDQFINLFGFERSNLQKIDLEDYVAPEWRAILRERHDRRMRGESVPAQFAYEGLRTDGKLLWLEADIVPLFDNTGTTTGTQSAIRDITERKQIENTLNWNRTLLHLMSNSSPLGFLVVDNRTDNILYFNERFCEIWGIEHLAGRIRSGELKNNDIIPDCLPVLMDVPAFAESCKPLQDENNRVIVEDEIAFTEKRTVRRFSTQIRGEHDEYYGRFYIFEEISERKQAETGLRQAKESLEAAHRELERSFAREQALARTDALTGVNSRGYLLELAIREFDAAMRYRPPLTMMIFDIDRFKQINDTFGHLMGDHVLKQVAQMVRIGMRSVDVIGRYGGDEFVILLPHTSAQEALPLAERIHANVGTILIETDKGPLTLTISLGIAQTIHIAPKPEVTAEPDTVENLFMRADQALYAAKQAGRNRTVIFDENFRPSHE